MTTEVKDYQLNFLNTADPSIGNIPLLSGTAVAPSRDSNPVQLLENSTKAEKINLPNGWHRTEKYGDVFVNAGKAWGVKIIGDRLENIIVDISEKDFLGNDHAFLRKDALRKQAEYARDKVTRRKPPNFTPQQVSTSTDGVSEVS